MGRLETSHGIVETPHGIAIPSHGSAEASHGSAKTPHRAAAQRPVRPETAYSRSVRSPVSGRRRGDVGRGKPYARRTAHAAGEGASTCTTQQPMRPAAALPRSTPSPAIGCCRPPAPDTRATTPPHGGWTPLGPILWAHSSRGCAALTRGYRVVRPLRGRQPHHQLAAGQPTAKRREACGPTVQPATKRREACGPTVRPAAKRREACGPIRAELICNRG